ncbi:MAG: hypothetical protein ABI721_04265 [Candidatus Dojkabacteria bacterium]
MRLINKVTAMLEDVRKPVQNVSELTDLTLSDYKAVRSTVKSALTFKDSAQNLFSRLTNRGEDKDDLPD